MPAAKAGLLDGDVVIKVDGHDVSHITTNADALRVLTAPAEEVLNLTVKRNEYILTFNVERVAVGK
jgi:C-terminal processing protease CtpA/Prc